MEILFADASVQYKFNHGKKVCALPQLPIFPIQSAG